MSAEPTGKSPVVFIHGLWLHAESWNRWVDYFKRKGYEAAAAKWPGDGETTLATRLNPTAVAGYGVTEIANHIAGQLSKFNRKPIVIGHSFGGLLAQNLLGRDLACAAIAIDPAPIRGVWQLPPSALKAAFPALGNPLNYGKAVSLTEAQFRYAFTNAVPEAEAKELYAKYNMPSPARPLFQAATAAFNPRSATKVNTANATRGPLLITAGMEDHTVPPVLSHSTQRCYRHSAASTELKEFPGRGHSLTIDSGWREIADACLAWLGSKHL